MKWICYALAMLMLSVGALAFPQVIFSSYNITIDVNSENVTYRVVNEGVEATETLPITTLNNDTNLSEWTFHYERIGIPTTFSRDVCEDTDVAVLINALANTNNVSQYWRDCLYEKDNCTSHLTVCEIDMGYKDNYTDSVNQVNNLKVSLASKDSDSMVKQKDIDNLKFQRMILLAAAIIAGVIAYKSWRKVTPKTLNSPGLSQLPRSVRM